MVVLADDEAVQSWKLRLNALKTGMSNFSQLDSIFLPSLVGVLNVVVVGFVVEVSKAIVVVSSALIVVLEPSVLDSSAPPGFMNS